MDVRICGQISGSVIFQNCCHSVAPSISAASYKFLGTLMIPPINKSIKSPIPAHTDGKTKDCNAQVVLPNQGTANFPNPIASKPEFTNPALGLKINCHNIPIITTDIIFGKKKIIR